MLLTLLATTAAVAGPWVHPRGQGYAKAGYTRFASADGFVQGEPTGLAFRSHSLDLYGELGLPAELQLVAGLPVVYAANISSSDLRYSHTWTGDLRLELDRRLLEGRPLAVGLQARIPTYRDPGEYNSVRGADDAYLGAIASQFPQLGDPNVDLTAVVIAGASAPSAWVAFSAGPRLRLGGFADGLYGDLNAGVWLLPSTLGLSLFSAGNLNLPRDLETDPGSRELLQVQGTAFLAGLPGDLTLEVWGGGVVLARHAATGTSFGAGVSRRFDLGA